MLEIGRLSVLYFHAPAMRILSFLHRQVNTREGAMGTKRKDLELNLRTVRHNTEENWTPGQALGEILGHLNRVENFTESESAAYSAQQRMRLLSSALQEAVQRAKLTGLDPARLTGIFRALEAYNIALSVERTVAAPSVHAACQLIRLEVSYLVPSAATHLGTRCPYRT